MSELELLRREVASLVANLSPFIGQEEMQARYNVTGQTLLAMERRKELPTRVKGRWLRTEVLAWEAANNPP
jgi:hypothetical protein